MHQEDTCRLTRIALEKVGASWYRSASVRMDDLLELNEMEFYPELVDFDEHLLPFSDSPIYTSLPDERKRELLSAAWLIYNEKTINIELELVSPLCNLICNSKMFSWEAREIASEILVDESYHTLLALRSSKAVRINRGLSNLDVSGYTLMENHSSLLKLKNNESHRLLARLAVATASELFISSYLEVLSSCPQIQPINRLTVQLHLADEIRHGNVFEHIAKEFYMKIPMGDRKLFTLYISMAATWFSSNEYVVWSKVLEQLGYAKSMLFTGNYIGAEKIVGAKRSAGKFIEKLEQIDNSQRLEEPDSVGII